MCLSDFSGRAEFSKKRSGPSEYDDDEGRRRGRNGDKNHHRRPIHPSIYKLPSLDLNQKRHNSTLLYSRAPSVPFYGSLPCVVEERRSPHSIISNLPSWPRRKARELRRLLQAVYEDGMDKMSEGEGRRRGRE